MTGRLRSRWVVPAALLSLLVTLVVARAPEATRRPQAGLRADAVAVAVLAPVSTGVDLGGGHRALPRLLAQQGRGALVPTAPVVGVVAGGHGGDLAAWWPCSPLAGQVMAMVGVGRCRGRAPPRDGPAPPTPA